VEKATLAAGCFWGVEADFRRIDGVTSTMFFYTAGRTENPTYGEVCKHGTGHAEAVEVEFDPAVVSYDDLLTHFWRMHNPTARNRQGMNFGDQYRSAIFTHGDEVAQVTGGRRGVTDGRVGQRRAGRWPRPSMLKNSWAAAICTAIDHDG